MRVAVYGGRPLDALMGLLWGTVDRYLVGDPMADRWLAELGAGRGRADPRRGGSSSTPCWSCLTLRAGRLSEAEALAARAPRPEDDSVTSTRLLAPARPVVRYRAHLMAAADATGWRAPGQHVAPRGPGKEGWESRRTHGSAGFCGT